MSTFIFLICQIPKGISQKNLMETFGSWTPLFVWQSWSCESILVVSAKYTQLTPITPWSGLHELIPTRSPRSCFMTSAFIKGLPKPSPYFFIEVFLIDFFRIRSARSQRHETPDWLTPITWYCLPGPLAQHHAAHPIAGPNWCWEVLNSECHCSWIQHGLPHGFAYLRHLDPLLIPPRLILGSSCWGVPLMGATNRSLVHTFFLFC